MSCTSESLDSLYWVELCRSSAYIWNESIIPLTNEMKPLKANNCVRSPAAAAAQKFVWIHFICIYNFLIQMWSRNEIGCLGARCSYLSWIIIQHSFWFGSVWLVYSLCQSTKERSLKRVWIQFMKLCKYDFYCLSIPSYFPYSLIISPVNKNFLCLCHYAKIKNWKAPNKEFPINSIALKQFRNTAAAWKIV